MYGPPTARTCGSGPDDRSFSKYDYTAFNLLWQPLKKKQTKSLILSAFRATNITQKLPPKTIYSIKIRRTSPTTPRSGVFTFSALRLASVGGFAPLRTTPQPGPVRADGLERGDKSPLPRNPPPNYAEGVPPSAPPQECTRVALYRSPLGSRCSLLCAPRRAACHLYPNTSISPRYSHLKIFLWTNDSNARIGRRDRGRLARKRYRASSLRAIRPAAAYTKPDYLPISSPSTFSIYSTYHEGICPCRIISISSSFGEKPASTISRHTESHH